ncbi:MAG: hypothetical protein KQJ78_20005 [Deltaproteobacteria bacterium]|nr:hypothetical protein [Deltaproteobacteria bacterium]
MKHLWPGLRSGKPVRGVVIVAVTLALCRFAGPAWAASPCPGEDAAAQPCAPVSRATLTVPPDFALTWSGGPTHAEWGAREAITLDARGRLQVRETRWDRPSRRDVVQVKLDQVITPAQVREVYALALGCGFFDLLPSYHNPQVRDGFVESLSLTAGGRTHQVSVYYCPVPRYQRLAAALRHLIKEK